MGRLLVGRADLLLGVVERLGQLGDASLQAFHPVSEDSNDLVELMDRLVLIGESGFELDDAVFHSRMLAGRREG